MNFDINIIKNLRDETGAGILEVKQVLENAAGDAAKAKEELMKKVAGKAAKKQDRVAKDGLVVSYLHNGGKVGSLLALGCETDFVAKTDDFQKLAKEIAMQVATFEYPNTEELLNAEYIRDGSKKIQDLINEVTAKVGEKIEIKRFVRFSALE